MKIIAENLVISSKKTNTHREEGEREREGEREMGDQNTQRLTTSANIES